MNSLQKTFIKQGVNLFLYLQAFLFRVKPLNSLGYLINDLTARLTISSKNIKKADSLAELGKNWQMGFPSNKQVPITGQDEQTVYAEIHTKCPLRGTGDVEACYKMMSYDRQIVEKAGGQFIVLQSQAEKGITKCSVAMKFKGISLSGLQHAHEKI